jgi:hypothetical protein
MVKTISSKLHLHPIGFAEEVIFLGITGITYIINETIQQPKHLYYHLTKKEHKLVERGDLDSDCFFDFLKKYIPKEDYCEEC